MIPRDFRRFSMHCVEPTENVVAVLANLNRRYIGYRTEGIIKAGPRYEIYFSYIENFSWDDEETEEPEEQEEE